MQPELLSGSIQCDGAPESGSPIQDGGLQAQQLGFESLAPVVPSWLSKSEPPWADLASSSVSLRSVSRNSVSLLRVLFFTEISSLWAFGPAWVPRVLSNLPAAPPSIGVRRDGIKGALPKNPRVHRSGFAILPSHQEALNRFFALFQVSGWAAGKSFALEDK